MPHFHYSESDPKQTIDILNPLRAISKARQLKKSPLNHIFASKRERYKEQIDDCPVKLELPIIVAPNASQNDSSSTNKEHPPNSKHNPQSKQGPKPNIIRILTQAIKGLFFTRWMLLTSLSTISKAANKPYKPKSYKKAIKDSI